MKTIKEISDGLYGTLKQHMNCKVCEEHPRFNLDEKMFLHGKYYTKEYILNALEIVNRLNERIKEYEKNCNHAYITLDLHLLQKIRDGI